MNLKSADEAQFVSVLFFPCYELNNRMKLCVWPLSPFMYVRTWKSIGFHLDSLLALSTYVVPWFIDKFRLSWSRLRKMRLLSSGESNSSRDTYIVSQSVVHYACLERIVFPRWVVSWKVVAKLRESLLQRAKRGGLWWWQLPCSSSTRICSSSSGRKAALRLQWRYAAAPVAALLLLPASQESRWSRPTKHKNILLSSLTFSGICTSPSYSKDQSWSKLLY